MTTYKPHNRYDFVCDITATVGKRDATIKLFEQFECQVDIDTELSGGGFDLEMRCVDVIKDGISLRNGDELAKLVYASVMELADANIEAGGSLFQDAMEREGLSLTGHPGDPDTCWSLAAE